MRRTFFSALPSLFSLSDEQAMWRVQTQDDADAFARLVERWEEPMQRLCTRMLGDRQRAEDLTQEVFARLFLKRRAYQPSAKFSTFLWRIALNLCYDELRRLQRRGAQTALNEWSLSHKKRPARAAQAWLKWGMAALLVWGLGYGLGRYATPPARRFSDLRAALEPALKASLEAALRQSIETALTHRWQTNFQATRALWWEELRRQNREQMDGLGAAVAADAGAEIQRLLAQFALGFAQERQKEYAQLQTALHQLDSQRASDYTNLRSDLEKLAVATQSELVRSQQQLVRLADFTLPQRGPDGLPAGTPQPQAIP